MSLEFDCPVGPHGDVKELEYVSALHQTGTPSIRKDGSISDIDIASFLASRYRIFLTPEEVRSTILNGFGGGDGEDDCIDLMEMVAILSIPTLLRAANNMNEKGKEYYPSDNSNPVVTNEDNTLGDSMNPPRGLLDYVLKMILHDVKDSIEPKALTKELLAEIFKSYGEQELANDDKLLEEMIELAREGCEKDEESSTLMFDTPTFARALTNDVQSYDVEDEFSPRTIFYDFFSDYNDEKKINTLSYFFKMEWLTRPIDLVADTYRSRLMVVALWTTFILFYFNFNGISTPAIDNCSHFLAEGKQTRAIFCLFHQNVVSWLMKVFVSAISGFLIVTLPSIGNSMGRRSLLSLTVGSLFTILTFYLMYFLLHVDFQSGKSQFIFSTIVALISTTVALGCRALQIFTFFTPIGGFPKYPKFSSLLIPTVVKSEVNVKKAASHKIGRMMQNALSVTKNNTDTDNVIDTYFGQALLSYSKLGDLTGKTAGFASTVKKFRNGDLMRKEGIWLSAKLIANTLTLIVFTIFFLWITINNLQTGIRTMSQEGVKLAVDKVLANTTGNVIESVTNSMSTFEHVANPLANVSFGILGGFLADNLRRSNINCSEIMSATLSLCESQNCSLFDPQFACRFSDSLLLEEQLELLKAFGLRDVEMLVQTQQILEDSIIDGINNLYPSHTYMVALPLIVFMIVGTLVTIFLTVTYVPSTVSTIMKLRSGFIPTFHDPSFNTFRQSADTVSLISGSVFWGCMYSSLLLGSLSALVVFLIVWQVTRSIVIRLVGTLMGIGVTLTIKQLLLLIFRRSSYNGLYRTSPGRASVIALLLECVDFALSVYFTFVRMVKLVIVAALFVGRVDTPVLAKGVGDVGPIKFDPLPDIFLKDILAHEAHRHPYISLMGMFYLLKLRHGEKFASKAGSCWRLIFVSALFPWMSKYRIQARPNMCLEQMTEKSVYFTSSELDTDFLTLRTGYSQKELTSSEVDKKMIDDLEKTIAELREKNATLSGRINELTNEKSS